jgi:Protein of unknown function (DUF4239)
VLSFFDDVVVILGCTLASLLCLWILQGVWPPYRRHEHNEIIGWQLSILGTTYAVIIGFMLYAVWTAFGAAEINADDEANCLVSVFRLADGLPPAQRVQIHRLAREYAEIVIDKEWPAMHKGELSPAGDATIQNLWAAATETKPASFAEQTSMSLTLTEIATMTEHRRLRQVQSESKLPGILWLLMILGGGVTVLSSCLFGTYSFKLHVIQVVALTLLLSLALVTIADINRPFQGTVHVLPRGFERARYTFAQTPVDTP